MQEADIREEDWLPILWKQLVGKALSIFMELSPREDTPYQDIKIDLLEQFGSTPQQARRVIWLEKPKTDEDPRSFLQRTRKALSRIKSLITSTEDALNEMFQGIMLRNYSNEALLHISQKPNDSRYHKAEDLQELWESMGYYEKTRMFRLQPQQPDGKQRWRQNTWSGAQGRSSSTKKEGDAPYIKGGATHTKQGWGEPRETRQHPRTPQKYCSGGSQASGNLSFSPKIVCFNCKKPGHIRRDCQEKHSLRRVRSPNPHLPELKRQGSINGKPCSFHLDTGADITAIPQNFVKHSQYTREVYNIQLGNKA